MSDRPTHPVQLNDGSWADEPCDCPTETPRTPRSDMTSQSDRVNTILRQLHEAEHERRQVAASGERPDRERHNDLANRIRDIVGEISTPDLRSLVTVMVVDGLNGQRWPRCETCGRPTYLGEAAARPNTLDDPGATR